MPEIILTFFISLAASVIANLITFLLTNRQDKNR